MSVVLALGSEDSVCRVLHSRADRKPKSKAQNPRLG